MDYCGCGGAYHRGLDHHIKAWYAQRPPGRSKFANDGPLEYPGDDMPSAKVAILRTTPATVLTDYHRLMNLADYESVIAKDADTALKINISWHFFFPGCSTTP